MALILLFGQSGSGVTMIADYLVQYMDFQICPLVTTNPSTQRGKYREPTQFSVETVIDIDDSRYGWTIPEGSENNIIMLDVELVTQPRPKDSYLVLVRALMPIRQTRLRHRFKDDEEQVIKIIKREYELFRDKELYADLVIESSNVIPYCACADIQDMLRGKKRSVLERIADSFRPTLNTIISVGENVNFNSLGMGIFLAVTLRFTSSFTPFVLGLITPSILLYSQAEDKTIYRSRRILPLVLLTSLILMLFQPFEFRIMCYDFVALFIEMWVVLSLASYVISRYYEGVK